MAEPLLQIDLPGVPLFRRGKVRDTFDLGDRLLMVSSDRVSAFDVIMPNGIPDKGRVLTQLSNFWFARTADLVRNHLLATDPADFPAELRPHADLLRGRAVLVRKAQRVDIECVVRGYLDRKSTRLNSSHANISYPVFCLKKKYLQSLFAAHPPYSLLSFSPLFYPFHRIFLLLALPSFLHRLPCLRLRPVFRPSSLPDSLP